MSAPHACAARRLAGMVMTLAFLLSSAGAAKSAPEAVSTTSPRSARLASRLRASAAPCDTVWIGHVVSGGSTPWHVGRGANRITGGGAAGTPAPSFNGVWCFDHFQAGDDTLMGWWPVALPYASTGGTSVSDRSRPFFGLDYGNQGNYVLNAANTPSRRTFGVVSYWHRDPGSALPPSAILGTNPAALTWLPLSGAASAWCGLRAHGDLAVVDPVTGNAFNESVLDYSGSNRGVDGPSGNATVIKNFPGYGSQWDQMLYRDAVIASDGVSLNVSFQYRTVLSTGASSDPGTRVGWFDKDPLKTPSVSDANFISATDAGAQAPVDSFMVYVGVPVDTASGIPQFFASDGSSSFVYDRQRRWFSEVIRINKPYVELLSKAGVNAASTFTVNIPNLTLQPILNALPGAGGTVRIVFRVKTNRGFDDEDNGSSGFSSGTAGAAIVDNVNVNTGGANLVSPGDFESSSSINNSLGTAATAAWKTTGKPPGVFFHVHNIVGTSPYLTALLYNDPAGPPGSSGRLCNMYGNVLTPGDHDSPAGPDNPGGIYGGSFQDRQDAVVSPTINLISSGGMPNSMGIDTDIANASLGYALWFDAYTNLYDYANTGNAYRIGWQSYPAIQPNGVRCWGDIQRETYLSTGPIGCFNGVQGSPPGARAARAIIVTSSVSGIPDSLRVFVEHISRCFTLPLTMQQCSPSSGMNAGGYFDNFSLAFMDTCALGSPKNVDVSADGTVDLNDPHPGIVASPSGILVAAWARRGGRVDYSRSRDGAMFNRERQIVEAASHPALARTSGGALLMTSASSAGVSCSRSMDEGLSFYPAVSIWSGSGAENPAMTVEANGTSHVAWDTAASSVYYAKSIDGVQFSGLAEVSAGEGPDRRHARPDVAIDDLHDAYVAWDHSHVTGTVEDWIQLNFNSGSGWTGPITISDTGRQARDVRIVAGSGVVYALWIYTTGAGPDAVHLSSAPSGSTSFQTVTEIPIYAADVGSTHALSAVLGSDGTLHVVFQASEGEGYGTPNEECFYMKRPSGGTFSYPVDFTRSPGPSQAPAITLDNSGAPVIVWSEQFGGGQDVFFTHP